MGEVSKNSWPSLTCHTVCHEVTTLTFLFALEGKSEKRMAKPESRSKRQERRRRSQGHRWRRCSDGTPFRQAGCWRARRPRPRPLPGRAPWQAPAASPATLRFPRGYTSRVHTSGLLEAKHFHPKCLPSFPMKRESRSSKPVESARPAFTGGLRAAETWPPEQITSGWCK